MNDAHSEVEVERKWLLHRLPDGLVDESLPVRSARIQILQGYLPPVSPDDPAWRDAKMATEHDVPTVGRIRAVESEAGNRYFHTLKAGSGLVRHEFEREISEAAFRAAWPSTAGRRLEKTRWRLHEEGVCWEIDRFVGLDVILVEAEIPSVEAAASLELPAWLKPVVDREVTDEDRFTNAEMAFRSGLGLGDVGPEGSSPESR